MNERPPHVEDARKRNDRSALRRMASKGGKVTAERRQMEKTIQTNETKDELTKAALEQAQTYSLSSEGDVLPPDPTIVKALEEELESQKLDGKFPHGRH
ncbi:MAG TPA: hypothetical protein VM103_00485 [Candidatus Paceibacterota bacterium]|nr:hypothetical protein [Candidatus Paceibacterota bacterium]